MKVKTITLLATLCFFWCTSTNVMAQEYDLLLKGGHVIDSRNNIDQLMDVAIADGKIAKVAANISKNTAKTVVDAKGLIVAPGFIDIHSHNFHGTEPGAYLSNSFSALPPDGFSFRSGVTTVVDVGGSGWRNFKLFKEQTIDRSKTRVLAFLNIIGSGMKGGAIEQNLIDMDSKLTAVVAKQYPNTIVGVKLAHYEGFDWTPTERAVEAGRLANIPVMIDFGGSEPELSLKTLLLEKLRAGDIFTHAYANVKGRTPVVAANGKVRDFVFEAQKKGVIFDVGHGGGSFVFGQAVPAIKQGFKPNSISTDLHTGSMNAGMKDITNIMSKFLAMEMSIKEIVDCVTNNSASIIQRPDLGSLSEGAVADVTVIRVRNGEFGFVDVKGQKIKGSKRVECELTLREGKVVWDLNGISKQVWKEK